MRFARGLAWTVAVPLWIWAGATLFFHPHWPSLARWFAIAMLTGATVAACRWAGRPRRSFSVLGLALVASLPWALERPSNDRAWSAGQEHAPEVTRDGDTLTIANVRHAHWRTPTEGEIRWETRRYDLRALRTVDLVVEPFDDWRGLAHIFVTFGFANGEHLAISIESRRETGETFSPTRGAFRHYELLYVIGDERDLIGLRANVRRDPVYLFPIRTSPEATRALLLSMVARAHSLAHQPEFYHTVTTTCATGLLRHLNDVRAAPVSGLDWRVIFPGFADELAWDLGLIDFEGTLEEARARFLINERSALDPALDGPGWSRRIRQVDS